MHLCARPHPALRAPTQIFETFEDPSYSAFAKWYSIGMMFLIVLATTCFVLETEAMVETGSLYHTSAKVSRLRLPLPRQPTAPSHCCFTSRCSDMHACVCAACCRACRACSPRCFRRCS